MRCISTFDCVMRQYGGKENVRSFTVVIHQRLTVIDVIDFFGNKSIYEWISGEWKHTAMF